MLRRTAFQSLLGVFIKIFIAQSGYGQWEVRGVKVIVSAVCEVSELVIKYIVSCLAVVHECLKVLGPWVLTATQGQERSSHEMAITITTE